MTNLYRGQFFNDPWLGNKFAGYVNDGGSGLGNTGIPAVTDTTIDSNGSSIERSASDVYLPLQDISKKGRYTTADEGPGHDLTLRFEMYHKGQYEYQIMNYNTTAPGGKSIRYIKNMRLDKVFDFGPLNDISEYKPVNWPNGGHGRYYSAYPYTCLLYTSPSPRD